MQIGRKTPPKAQICIKKCRLVFFDKDFDFSIKTNDFLQKQPKPTYFCNGGDQNNNSIPETDICKKLNIELRDGFGEKIQSSSWLLDKSKNIT